MKRKAISMAEKLDAALLALLEAQGVPIPREEQRGLQIGAVASRFDFDHWPQTVALGGTNHPSNLVPRLRAEHRAKTAKTDIPMIAKVKRNGKAYEAFKAKMLAKVRGEVEEIMTGAKRAGKRKAEIRNRGFDKTRSRRFNGTVVTRGE